MMLPANGSRTKPSCDAGRIRSAGRGDSANRIGDAAGDGARRGRIENLSECEGAAQHVGTRAALRQQFGEICVAAAALERGRHRGDRTAPPGGYAFLRSP